MRISDWSSDVCSSDLFHLSSADPKVVGTAAVRPVTETNYDVADQLSGMGMEAIHPSAAKGLRQAGIPLCIKNTFDPEAPGATIRGDLQAEAPAVELITGLKRVYAFEFFEQDMVGVKGYDRSEEHTSELQSLMRISYAVFCLKKKTKKTQ